MPHRSGRRLLPVMAAFFWAVALHVAVAAGLAGLSGQSARVDSSPRGFKLVQAAGGTQASGSSAERPASQDQGAQPGPKASPQAPDKPPTPSETGLPNPQGSADSGSTGTPAPETKTASPGLKRRVAEAPVAKPSTAPETAERSTTDTAKAESGPTSNRDPVGQTRQTPAPSPEPQPDPAPDSPEPAQAANGGAYQPPGVPSGYRSNPSPAYPSQARRRGLEGTVVLEVRVGPDGRAMRVRIDRSSGHSVLDRAAREAVRGWSFRPATRGGKKVAGAVKVPIRFRLAGR